MANVFLNLPTPAANGAGTAVDVSSLGGLKTVTVSRTAGVFQPYVTIEISCDAAGLAWTPIKTFGAAGQASFSIACLWMRATISNYRGGGPINVDVGGDDAGTTALDLPALVTNGAGAPVDISAEENFKTIQVGGPFRGAVNVEISVDGSSYETVASFRTPGQFTSTFAAQFMRVVRVGVPSVSAGLPTVTVAATASGGGGGGGGGTVGPGTIDTLAVFTGPNAVGDSDIVFVPINSQWVIPRRTLISVNLNEPAASGGDPALTVHTVGTNLTQHDGGVQSFNNAHYDLSITPSAISQAYLGAAEATKTGGGTLVNTVYAASVSGGDENYSFKATTGTFRNDEDGVFGTALTVGPGAAANTGECVLHVDLLIDNVQQVELGNHVGNFVVPGDAASSPCIAIGASATGAAQVNTKNTVALNPDSGYQALLDTTVNAGARGGLVVWRGAAGGLGGANQMGITYSGGADHYIIGSTVNDVCVFNTAVGKRLLLSANGTGFTVGASLDNAGLLIARALMTGDPTAGTGAKWTANAGSPAGVVVGNVGDLYTDTAGGAGTTFYVKEGGGGTSAGWVAK